MASSHDSGHPFERLATGSREYRTVRYQLAAILGDARACVRDVEIHAVKTLPTRAEAFDRLSGLKLEVVADVAGRDAVALCRDGFSDDMMGKEIFCTSFDLPESRAADDEHQLLLCTLAAGVAYPLPLQSLTEETGCALTTTPPPKGYDSYYWKKGPSTSTPSAAAASSSSTYTHHYSVLAPERVRPRYFVEFRTAEKDLSGARCAICEDLVGTLYCDKCEALLCEACDATHHGSNKLMQRHKRQLVVEHLDLGGVGEDLSTEAAAAAQDVPSKLEALKAKSQSFRIKSSCPAHPNMGIDFFDPVDNVPVCVYCKMVGSHSSGPAAQHKLIGIMEAYDAAVRASTAPAPGIAAKLAAVDASLEDVRRRREDIDANAAAVEEELRQRLQVALDEAARAAGVKRKVVEAEEAELLRQRNEMRHQGQFLAQQRSIQGPVDFLQSWDAHQASRRRLVAFERPSPPALVALRPDLRVHGQIGVVTGEGGQEMGGDEEEKGLDDDVNKAVSSEASSSSGNDENNSNSLAAPSTAERTRHARLRRRAKKRASLGGDSLRMSLGRKQLMLGDDGGEEEEEDSDSAMMKHHHQTTTTTTTTTPLQVLFERGNENSR